MEIVFRREDRGLNENRATLGDTLSRYENYDAIYDLIEMWGVFFDKERTFSLYDTLPLFFFLWAGGGPQTTLRIFIFLTTEIRVMLLFELCI